MNATAFNKTLETPIMFVFSPLDHSLTQFFCIDTNLNESDLHAMDITSAEKETRFICVILMHAI